MADQFYENFLSYHINVSINKSSLLHKHTFIYGLFLILKIPPFVNSNHHWSSRSKDLDRLRSFLD